MYRIAERIHGHHCSIEILEPALTAGFDDEICDVTEFSRRLAALLAQGVSEIELDLSRLRRIDEAALALLDRLQRRVDLSLVLPEDGCTIEPASLAVQLYTQFESKQLEFAA